MCFFIYGAVNAETNTADLEKLLPGSKYVFRHGTKHDIKQDVLSGRGEFCIRRSVCDCDFPVGKGDKDAPELKALAETLHNLRSARGIKCVYLAKAWEGEPIKSERQAHIDDIDAAAFLAEAEEGCLYRIDLYRKYL